MRSNFSLDEQSLQPVGQNVNAGAGIHRATRLSDRNSVSQQRRYPVIPATYPLECVLLKNAAFFVFFEKLI